MGKKSISKNYLYQLSYQILALIIPLITTPYISRVLGAEGIGIYSFTYSIATYFILFGSLGIAMYGQREIAYVQDKKEERSRIFWEIVILRLVLMTISATVFYFAYCTGEEYQLYYKILLIELFSNAIDISWFFQGLEEFKKTVTRNFIIKAAFTICIFIFVFFSADLTKYFFVAIGGNLLGNLSLWIYVPKYVQKIKIKSLKVFRHLKHTFFLFIPQIATQVYTILDKTMIGYIVADKSEVGYYEQAQKVINMLLTLVTSLGTVMVPRMANTFASGDKEQMKRYLQNSFKFTYTIAFPVMLGVIAVSANFVPIFFGEGYESVVPLINILAITILFIGMSNVTGTQLLLPTKRQKEFTISVTIGAIVNFVLNWIFIYHYRAIGGAITTVISEILVAGIQLWFLRKEWDLKEILKLARNNVIAGVLMFIVAYGIGMVISNPILGIVLQMAAGVAVYGITLLLLKDPFVFYLLERFKIIKPKGEKVKE